jgi:hypothetical protein
MVAMSEDDGRRPMACVYSSETGMWGNIIRHDHPCSIVEFVGPSTLAGHVLSWVISFGSDDDEHHGVLEFDLERHRLTVLKGPPINQSLCCWAIKAMNGDKSVNFFFSKCKKIKNKEWPAKHYLFHLFSTDINVFLDGNGRQVGRPSFSV